MQMKSERGLQAVLTKQVINDSCESVISLHGFGDLTRPF